MLSQVQNNIQGTQFTPVVKEESSVRANWIALPLQQALVFLLVERRPLENQKSGSPVFVGTLAFQRSAGFQRRSFCFLSMQSVCRMSSLLFLWQLQQPAPSEALQAAPRGWSLGMGWWEGDPRVEHTILPWKNPSTDDFIGICLCTMEDCQTSS